MTTLKWKSLSKLYVYLMGIKTILISSAKWSLSEATRWKTGIFESGPGRRSIRASDELAVAMSAIANVWRSGRLDWRCWRRVRLNGNINFDGRK